MSRTLLRWITAVWTVAGVALGLVMAFGHADAINMSHPSVLVVLYWIVFGAISAIGYVWIRNQLAPGWIARRREEVLAKVKQTQTLLGDAVQLADAVKPAGESNTYGSKLSYRLDDIDKALRKIQGVEPSQEAVQLDAFEEEVQSIAQRRAYIIPAYVLDVEANDKFAELKAWGVPAGALAGLEEQIAKLGESSSTLRTSLEACVAKFDPAQREAISRALKEIEKTAGTPTAGTPTAGTSTADTAGATSLSGSPSAGATVSPSPGATEPGSASSGVANPGSTPAGPFAQLLGSLKKIHDGDGEILKELLAVIRSIDEETNKKRALLEKVYEAHDYWDWYTDWYLQTAATTLSIVLGGVSLTCLGLSLACLVNWHYLPLGMILAGASGATLSVLMKLPPLSVFGEVAGSFLRIGGRVVGGTIGSIVGIALVGSGIINIGLPASGAGGFQSMRTIIDSCAYECVSDAGPLAPSTLVDGGAAPLSSSGSISAKAIAQVVAQMAVSLPMMPPSDAGLASATGSDAPTVLSAIDGGAGPLRAKDGGADDAPLDAWRDAEPVTVARDAGIATAGVDGGSTSLPAAGAGAPVAPPKDDGRIPCTTSMILLLVALGILFGFSERAIPSFENVVMKGVVGTGTSGK